MIKTKQGQIVAAIILLIVGMIAYKLILDNKAKKATGKNIMDLIKANVTAPAAAAPATTPAA